MLFFQVMSTSFLVVLIVLRFRDKRAARQSWLELRQAIGAVHQTTLTLAKIAPRASAAELEQHVDAAAAPAAVSSSRLSTRSRTSSSLSSSPASLLLEQVVEQVDDVPRLPWFHGAGWYYGSGFDRWDVRRFDVYPQFLRDLPHAAKWALSLSTRITDISGPFNGLEAAKIHAIAAAEAVNSTSVSSPMDPERESMDGATSVMDAPDALLLSIPRPARMPEGLR